MNLNLEQVLSRFRRKKPANEIEALMSCKVPLTFLGEGAFRRTYRVGDLPLVAKFPYESLELDATIESGTRHSLIEVNTIKRLQKYATLKDYLPKVYHFNRKTGVVLMHEYKELRWNKQDQKKCEDLSDEIHEAVQEEWLGSTLDCHPDNIGQDETGKLILLDLGCFES